MTTRLTHVQVEEIAARDAQYKERNFGPHQPERDRRALLAHVAALEGEVKKQSDGWSEAFKLAAFHQSRAEKAEADLAACRRDAERYRWLRRSVLQAPMSAGFTSLTNEADIDAQCDQLALSAQAGEK